MSKEETTKPSGNKKSPEDCWFRFYVKKAIPKLDFINSKELKILLYIFNNTDFKSNELFIRPEDVMNATEIKSKSTVINTVKSLIDSGFMIRISQGHYMINPEIMFSGNDVRRKAAIARYKDKKSFIQYVPKNNMDPVDNNPFSNMYDEVPPPSDLDCPIQL